MGKKRRLFLNRGLKSNANLRISYGSYKISYEEFLKLVKKAGKSNYV